VKHAHNKCSDKSECRGVQRRSDNANRSGVRLVPNSRHGTTSRRVDNSNTGCIEGGAS
jgi:hypothetical protein